MSNILRRIRVAHLPFVVLVAALVLLVARVALAQGGAPVAPPAPLNPVEMVAVCSGAYAILTALASVMRADNTALALAPPVVARLITVITAGTLQAGLLLIVTGTPWYVVVPAMAFTTYAAWMKDGKRVAPGATPAEAVASKSGRPPAMPEPPKAA